MRQDVKIPPPHQIQSKRRAMRAQAAAALVAAVVAAVVCDDFVQSAVSGRGSGSERRMPCVHALRLYTTQSVSVSAVQTTCVPPDVGRYIHKSSLMWQAVVGLLLLHQCQHGT